MSVAQKTAVILAMLLISSGLVVLLVIFPAANDIIAYNARIQAERAALENKYTNRRNIKNVIADIHFVNAKLPTLANKMLIARGGEVSFISELEDVAAKYRVAQKVALGAAESYGQGNIINRRRINILLGGDYINILRYISAMEQLGYYINVQNVRANSEGSARPKGAESSGDVKANLEGYIYVSIQ